MNTSGFAPLDLRVLVLPDPVAEKHGSILLPDEIKEQDKWAQAKGTLIAIGENAWEEAVARGTRFVRPAAGERVLFGKYSGQTVTGTDGKEYRIMNDEDVIARLEE